MILGQLTMGARQTKNAPLLSIMMVSLHYLGLVLWWRIAIGDGKNIFGEYRDILFEYYAGE